MYPVDEPGSCRPARTEEILCRVCGLILSISAKKPRIEILFLSMQNETPPYRSS
ncbi:MAG: hypothetical protein JXA44_05475 [Methanospirillaceae archaeon]|nr:hypothetical protein [Methanospirillaceae archaeon]